MRNLFKSKRNDSEATEKLRAAPRNSHQHKCGCTFLLPLVFCGSILMVLIMKEFDMMLIGSIFETATLGRRTLSRPPSNSSDLFLLNVNQDLWAHEATTTLEQIQEATKKAPCHTAFTHHAYVFGLPNPTFNNPVQLTAGPVHTLTISSYDIHGQSRCAGGDYFETDLSSNTWKARPPVADLANGSYRLYLQVDPQHIGRFVLEVILSFTNFQEFVWMGVYKRLPTWRGDVVLKMEIEFILDTAVDLGDLATQECSASRGHFDFQRWIGRWTRMASRDECPVDAEGRYRCLDLDTQCQRPWCQGPLGRLESNGWVYSAHCNFKIFTEEEAWTCLNNKWLLFWGDSNHQDTIRNLLSFVLGFPLFNSWIDRRFDQVFNRVGTSNDRLQQQQSLRITSIFNGHTSQFGDGQGLWSMSDPRFCSATEKYFDVQKEKPPDVVILNSGLHDAIYWKTPFDYVNIGVKLAIDFWNKVLNKNVVRQQPLVIYRHTVAPAAEDGKSIFNPAKIEWYTRMLGEQFAKLNIKKFRIVDDFDITFPWHYDLRCSDGMHYGRPPSKATWKDGISGHQYFVDLMLVHIHLNAICIS